MLSLHGMHALARNPLLDGIVGALLTTVDRHPHTATASTHYLVASNRYPTQFACIKHVQFGKHHPGKHHKQHTS